MHMIKDRLFHLCRNKVFVFMICAICLLLGSVYYFGIHLGFVPQGEETSLMWRWNLIVHGNGKYQHINVVSDLIAYISAQIGGCSFFSTRLYSTLMYTVVLFFTMHLCLKPKRGGEVSLWLLPLYALFMIFVHIVGTGSEFGKIFTDTDLVYLLPYDYHLMPLIFALCSIFMIGCMLRSTNPKSRKRYFIVNLIIAVYGMLFSDLIYYIIFVGPVLFTLFLRGLRDKKKKKYCFMVLAAGLFLLFITRVLPLDLCESFWTQEKADHYGEIYGATNWLNIDNFFAHIENYLKVILQLFNAEFSDAPVLSFYSVVYFVRVVFIVIGHILVFRILKSSMIGNIRDTSYDYIDEVLAWGYFLLFCSFIFTYNGYYMALIRYYGAFVPLLTIILCRNMKDYLNEKFHRILCGVRYKKSVFFVSISVICICCAQPVWLYEAEDSYMQDCEEAIRYIEETDLGYAIAPYYFYSRLTAMCHGDIIFYPNEQAIRDYNGDEAQLMYIVTGFENIDHVTSLMNIGVDDYEDLCEKYTVPTRVLELDHFNVCVFENYEGNRGQGDAD